MSSSDKKYIGESTLSGQPEKHLVLKLKDGSVTTEKIANRAVTSNKIDGSVYRTIVKPYIDNLQNQISTMAGASGYALSTAFGNDTNVGICQKTLTDAFAKVWDKLEDITGETLQGIDMVVTPTYFVGEDGATITVTAAAVDTNGIFENIEFYVNGVLIESATNTDYYTFTSEITDTSVITCKATIMGVEYTRSKTVTRYNSFWLGAGATYTSVMTQANLVSIGDSFAGTYDVTCAAGDRIIIILDQSARAAFLRADMNSVEIPFTETTITSGGNTYSVLTSVNTYTAGTYNIDINV